jgi:hypothetical protein
MPHESFTYLHLTIGISAAWAIFFFEVIYAITLALGLLSLESPQDQIGDPFFSMLEILIIFIAPLLVIVMVAVNAYAAPDVRAYSQIALAFTILAAGTTSCVHFVILTVSRQIAASGFDWTPLFLSFTWPSVAYALDILAWDVFFALALLFAAPIFKGSGNKKAVRWLMIISGVLSLAGLIGVPLADMQIRMIGVVGYAGIAPIAFLVLGFVFKRTPVPAHQSNPANNGNGRN